MPYILGLTGNIASGKTSVGLMLLELGAATYVDADMVVHELYLPGQPLATRLAEAFGPQVLAPDGGVDRRILGQIVFGDQEKLRQLEALVHPAVQTALISRLRALPADAVGVLDAIKLIESGYAPFCQGIWLVVTTPETQMERLMSNRGLSEIEARQRLDAQPPIDPKRALVTEVLENTGSLADLREQVTAAWARFTAALT